MADFRSEIRNRLQRRRGELLGLLHVEENEALTELTPNSTGEISSRRLHPADLATDAEEQDVDLRVAEQVSGELRDIDDALERMYQDEYGVCQNCKSDISAQRLLAHPYARFCTRCASSFENRSLS